MLVSFFSRSLISLRKLWKLRDVIEIDNYFSTLFNSSKSFKLFEKKHFVQNKMLAQVCRRGKSIQFSMYKVMRMIQGWKIREASIFRTITIASFLFDWIDFTAGCIWKYPFLKMQINCSKGHKIFRLNFIFDQKVFSWIAGIYWKIFQWKIFHRKTSQSEKYSAYENIPVIKHSKVDFQLTDLDKFTFKYFLCGIFFFLEYFLH